MSDEFDLSDFDGPPDRPSTARQTRADADAANAGRLLSHIRADVRQLAGAVAGFEAIGADLRARLAEAVARDADRAEAETARDEQIVARLIDPTELASRAEIGARQGVYGALEVSATSLRRQIEADTQAREVMRDHLKADQADRRAHEARRYRHDTLRNGAIICIALLIPVAFGYGYRLGDDAGETSGYARARDEVAAVSWANTPNGKLARRIDQASVETLPDIAACPRANGWHSEKRNGYRYCFGMNTDRKTTTGWAMP